MELVWLWEGVKVLVGVGTFAGAITSAYINKSTQKHIQKQHAMISDKLEKIKIYENQSASKKADQAEKICKNYVDALVDNKHSKKEKEKKFKEMRKELTEILGQIFFYASDSTVRRFVEWKNIDNSRFPEDDIGLVHSVFLAKLIIEYRKDLGNTDTTITHEDLLSSQLNDWNNVKERFKNYI
ncbi:hypothetical protein [Bacillus safensis]|uniref:hypothetical protein n=1 Tax=Bacillus safensis TaxID=561879 RepID=UPI00090B9AE7|nr:hypothetical protein [Bacillus safensis]APJ11108.1 hypothetical protein BSL056_09115 [Bacillus safensis]